MALVEKPDVTMTFELKGESCSVSSSGGVTQGTISDNHTQTLISRADSPQYKSKKTGRTKVFATDSIVA